MERHLGLKVLTTPLSPPRDPAGEKVASFTPAWWCRNPHLQTLWPVFFRRNLRPKARRERLELPDGDFVDLDWTLNDSGPIVIIFHGLEGSSRSHYARSMLDLLPRKGYRAVVMHFRGCSGESNRLARAYHSGDTGDIDFLVRTLKAREPNTPLAAMGYSLGGNALLKWLSELNDRAPVECAVAVSVPFLLQESTAQLNHGIARLYQWHLLKSLKHSALRKAAKFTPPVSVEEIRRIKTFYEFDDRITAPLHGFDGAMNYYISSSSRQYLKKIRTPTLIIHAMDDPFMHAQVIPGASELSAAIELDLHRHGGHVGFVAGYLPWKARYWLDERAVNWLQQNIA